GSGHTGAIIGARAGIAAPAGREPGERTAPAESDQADLAGVGHRGASGVKIVERELEVPGFIGSLRTVVAVVRIVVDKPALFAVVERRRDRAIAIGGKEIAHRAQIR